MFILGKILAALILPPGAFVLAAIACALLAKGGKKKAATIAAWASALTLYALATPFFSSALTLPLEDSFPPAASRGDARAIVVLGGGYNDVSPEYGNSGALSEASEKRAIYGLELSRAYGLPLVFSGGKGLDEGLGGNEAQAAKSLWRSLGVGEESITLEDKSADTKGNAFGVALVAGSGPFLLVTSAAHMPRAMLSFEKAGVKVVAAPTDYRAKRGRRSWVDFLPGASSLELSTFALHEYIGLAYYRMTL
jgi:uncharacterized SAM-binding protein YcdF (DUF218 family)